MTLPDSAPNPTSEQPLAPASHGGSHVPAPAVAAAQTEYVQVAGHGVHKLASIGQRAVARLLDMVVVFLLVLLCIVLGAVLGGAAGSTSSVNSGEAAAVGGVMGMIGAIFMGMLLAYAYETVMVAVCGQTVGKMIMKIKVIQAIGGGRPNVGASFVRYLIPGVCSLIPFIGAFGTILCFLSATFDGSGRRQGWHDKIAGTYVVSAAA